MGSLNVPEKVEPLKPHGEVVDGQMDNLESLIKACEGVDTAIHLAGQASANARWDSLMKENIDGYDIHLNASSVGRKTVFFFIEHTIYFSQRKRQV